MEERYMRRSQNRSVPIGHHDIVRIDETVRAAICQGKISVKEVDRCRECKAYPAQVPSRPSRVLQVAWSSGVLWSWFCLMRRVGRQNGKSCTKVGYSLTMWGQSLAEVVLPRDFEEIIFIQEMKRSSTGKLVIYIYSQTLLYRNAL